jgi:hypothetical protein
LAERAVLFSADFVLDISNNGLAYLDPGATGFTPASPQTCSSYMTSGLQSLPMVEVFAQFRHDQVGKAEGSFAVERPYYPLNTAAVVLQLSMKEANVASGTFFFISPSQVYWTGRASCGPGSASVGSLCSAAKSADLSGDGLVTIVDVVLVLDVWGVCGVTNSQCALADFDCNGVVDLFDVAYVLNRWKTT